MLFGMEMFSKPLFAIESQPILFESSITAEYFQSGVSPQLSMACTVNNSHSAAAEFSQHFVAAERMDRGSLCGGRGRNPRGGDKGGQKQQAAQHHESESDNASRGEDDVGISLDDHAQIPIGVPPPGADDIDSRIVLVILNPNIG